MRRLLIVAPAFPPHPSPATHRARFIANHAASFGWEVEVAAVRPEDYVEPLDLDLARLLPRELRVTYSHAWSARWTRRVGIGDLGLRSYFPLRRVVRRICEARRPDLIFVSGPPCYTFGIAARMRDEFGIPYVLDYTDPWVHPLPAGSDGPTRKAYWANRLALALEPAAVRGAAHLLAVSDATHDGVRERHPEIPASRFSAVPFGFEAADFVAARAAGVENPAFAPNDGLRHVVYVGAVPPSMAETVRALLTALRALGERRPELIARTRLHFVGTSYDPFATEGLVTRLARELGVGHLVLERTTRVPYASALRVLGDADVILALGSVDAHYTASKIFNCILAGRPLVTVFHEDSPVVDFVRRTRAGELVTYGDDQRAESRTPEIAAALERALDAAPEDAPAGRDLDPLREFSAESMTRRILAICDAAVAGGLQPAAAPAISYARG